SAATEACDIVGFATATGTGPVVAAASLSAAGAVDSAAGSLASTAGAAAGVEPSATSPVDGVSRAAFADVCAPPELRTGIEPVAASSAASVALLSVDVEVCAPPELLTCIEPVDSPDDVADWRAGDESPTADSSPGSPTSSVAGLDASCDAE